MNKLRLVLLLAAFGFAAADWLVQGTCLASNYIMDVEYSNGNCVPAVNKVFDFEKITTSADGRLYTVYSCPDSTCAKKCVAKQGIITPFKDCASTPNFAYTTAEDPADWVAKQLPGRFSSQDSFDNCTTVQKAEFIATNRCYDDGQTSSIFSCGGGGSLLIIQPFSDRRCQQKQQAYEIPLTPCPTAMKHGHYSFNECV